MAEAQASGEVDIGPRLDALRARGADRLAPVRFAYLAALARRLANQPESVRRLLTAKFQREANELEARGGNSMAAVAAPTGIPAKSPLAALLDYIGEHAVAPPRENQPGPAAPSPTPRPSCEPVAAGATELKSVAYFRDAWSKLSTEQRLIQTLAQAPENAGPMNSQHLVLCALKAMRDCSPEYLQAFMSYVDTLVWLEHASPIKLNAEPPRQEKGKTTKRGSGKS